MFRSGVVKLVLAVGGGCFGFLLGAFVREQFARGFVARASCFREELPILFVGSAHTTGPILMKGTYYLF